MSSFSGSAACMVTFEKDSPSCGMEDVKIWKARVPSRNGVGIYAVRLDGEPAVPAG